MVQQIKTQHHLSTYWKDRVVQYFQNEIVACSLNQIMDFKQLCIALRINICSGPILTGIIGLITAQPCKKALQNMESCPLKPAKLWSGMVQQITTQRHLST